MFFSSVFGHQNPGSGLDPDSLEMLDKDPYPDPDSINPDPQLYFLQYYCWGPNTNLVNGCRLQLSGVDRRVVVHHDLQCCGSMKFRYWSGLGSVSEDPYLQLMYPDPDPAIFFSDLQDVNKKLIKFFCFLLFEGTFSSFFKDTKS